MINLNLNLNKSKALEESTIIKLHLLTGSAWTKAIEVEGSPNHDIIQLIDDYYYEQNDLPVPMYTMDELDEYELETYIPINGGEYWIEGVSHIDEIYNYTSINDI